MKQFKLIQFLRIKTEWFSRAYLASNIAFFIDFLNHIHIERCEPLVFSKITKQGFLSNKGKWIGLGLLGYLQQYAAHGIYYFKGLSIFIKHFITIAAPSRNHQNCEFNTSSSRQIFRYGWDQKFGQLGRTFRTNTAYTILYWDWQSALTNCPCIN